ncbi:MAG: hypothetical protein JWR60_2261 [Polaromonas sp.]|nr:hypothetical protein [Polaromonas sp.]
MCLIAFAINASPHWPLVIASNRDEFLDRPTLPLACWQAASGQEIISGRDLRAGGTWLGMTPGGRMAFLTNVRSAAPQAGARSRGELVTRWLEAHGDAAAFAAALAKESAAYGGFNLVVGDFSRHDWMWMTNKPSTTAHGWQAQALLPGIYGVSNAGLDTPWPKTIELKRVLAAALAEQASRVDPAALQASLWAALASRDRPSVDQLPDTGVSLSVEQALSSAFVDFAEHAYGTRCSTVMLAASKQLNSDVRHWKFRIEEKTYSHKKDDLGLADCLVISF